jgi:DNA polymerase-3 subunit alpha
MMEKFAGYGFNKSHAAAYTLLAYQTAYLKRYFPSAFYASWLSIESEEDTETIPALIKDAKHHGITILPPCINNSHQQFETKLGTHELRYGFAGLKGLGYETADAIIHERNKCGSFSSLRDFIKRLGSKANKKTLDVLAKSGAFDIWSTNRGELLSAIPLEMKYNKEKIKYEEKKAIHIKDGKKSPPPPSPPEIGYCPPQSLLQMLAGERDAFGFFFSKHPYEYYAGILGGLKSCEPLQAIAQRPIDWDQHMIAGVVSNVRIIETKAGKLLIATIGDGSMEIEVKGFSGIANKVADWFKKDAFALMAVQLREDRMRGGKSIQVTDAQPFARASILLAESVHILATPGELRDILSMASRHPGTLPLFVWHPAGEALARSSAPYAYVQQTQECFDAFSQKHQELCMISHQQGKPPGLLS